jgi:hypothetical protein
MDFCSTHVFCLKKVDNRRYFIAGGLPMAGRIITHSVVGLEWGPLSLVMITVELLEWKVAALV